MNKLINYLEKLCKTEKTGGLCHTDKSVESLREKIRYVKENSPFQDTMLWLNTTEFNLLGVALSTQKIDVYDKTEVTHNISDFLGNPNVRGNFQYVFGVDILDVQEFVTKSGDSQGKKRAVILVGDSSGKIKITVWATEYEKFSSILVKNNSAILTVSQGKGKYSQQLTLVDAKQAI